MDIGWPDLLAAAIVVWYAAFAMRRGFVAVLTALLGFILAFVLAFVFYPSLASYLTGQFGWSPVWSKPIAFVALWMLIESAFSLASRFLSSRMSSSEARSQANRSLAVLPGALQGLIFAALILTVIAVMPVQGGARQAVVESPVGGKLVQFTLGLARPLESIFGPAARETLGFITIRPPQPGVKSDENIKLNFTTDDAVPDPANEDGMLALVNRERTSRGLEPLQMDDELTQVARAHARDMFKRGYFAHVTPDGKDPFDRMSDAGIVYGFAGENLALAPTLDMAHDGLMNSPGHKANILNGDYRKVGIGVLDGGVYGKMFVQEFSD